ncbi:MAG: DUF488 domain-containing protein [Myxococcales bacterium]|nr:DUF488 domain-containing protein [Myxococcales bacterium]MDD9967308.1 DUF488 domain-containing protein [Myxococcales bacterium]
MSDLCSIGYATKPLPVFMEQLQTWRITAVADIRSVPYSKRFHEYHREALEARLRSARIPYVYLGAELGPRSKDPGHYDSKGQVQFERLQGSLSFRRGIERLQRGMAKGLRIAMLCAEKDPAICHRSLLVGDYLQAKHGIETAHILHDGGLESQRVLQHRLMDDHGIAPDLLRTEPECVRLAWRAQCRRFAYRRPG